MPEERWPAIIHLWIPAGRRKRRRPRRSWREGITEAMKKSEMREEDAQDRIFWRRVIGKAADSRISPYIIIKNNIKTC
jgi:hypothetical protein